MDFILIFGSLYFSQIFISCFTPYMKLIEKLVGEKKANQMITIIALIGAIIIVTNVDITQGMSDDGDSPVAATCRYCY